jgi:two-component system, NtrC family, nitrogen regulation sensor histidine kinase NtrY
MRIDAGVTLRARLLLSALVLSLATTLALGLIVRASWQTAESQRFEAELEEALLRLNTKLQDKQASLARTLQPLCEHDPIIDSALLGLRGGSMTSRLLSLRARVPELKKSLNLSELSLVSSQGQIIAGDSPPLEGTPGEVKAWVQSIYGKPGLRKVPRLAFEAACLKGDSTSWVALVAALEVDSLLQEAGQTADLRLSLQAEAGMIEFDPAALHIEERPIAALDGAILRAERSRRSLRANLAHLDSEVLSAALAALFGALLLALFLSRGLALPVVRFAESTRQAVQGRATELPVSGGPELEQAARAFNATLEDLRVLRERLKVTERIAARREIARQVAHEIKNPLSPIRTSIETLRKLKERNHEDFDAYFHETTATVLDEVKRINTLVSHFAEYARLPSPSPVETDLGELVEQLVALHQDLGAKLTLQANPPHRVQADKDQISQVVTNLLKNAIEATSQTEKPHVLVTIEQDDSRREIVLSVNDNGPGLLAEVAQRVFEPYMTTKPEGTGLGLPISHRIAIEHGGDLTYTTSPLGGARFTLRLPLDGPPLLQQTEEGPA